MITNAHEHLDLLHHGTDSYITIAKKENGIFKQKSMKPVELFKSLDQWQGNDVYFSQNNFFIPCRRIDTVRELRSLYVDLDFYRVLGNHDPKHIVLLLEQDCFRRVIPEPNFILYSGRGLVLEWLIEPARNFSLPLWHRIQQHFYSVLQEYGADRCSLDAARIFRLAGSVNSKSRKLVYLEQRHAHRFTLREIAEDYLPEINSSKKPRKSSSKSTNRKTTAANGFDVLSLHFQRLQDLKRLVQLRNYDMSHCRERSCLLYRYLTLVYIHDPKESLRQTIDFNAQFTNPLNEKEVIIATKNAEKYYEKFVSESELEKARAKGFPSAGLNLKSQTIIDWLEITPHEQRKLKTIISQDEKYRRNNDRREAQRRREGKPTRAECYYCPILSEN